MMWIFIKGYLGISFFHEKNSHVTIYVQAQTWRLESAEEAVFSFIKILKWPSKKENGLMLWNKTVCKMDYNPEIVSSVHDRSRYSEHS